MSLTENDAGTQQSLQSKLASVKVEDISDSSGELLAVTSSLDNPNLLLEAKPFALGSTPHQSLSSAAPPPSPNPGSLNNSTSHSKPPIPPLHISSSHPSKPSPGPGPSSDKKTQTAAQSTAQLTALLDEYAQMYGEVLEYVREENQKKSELVVALHQERLGKVRRDADPVLKEDEFKDFH